MACIIPEERNCACTGTRALCQPLPTAAHGLLMARRASSTALVQQHLAQPHYCSLAGAALSPTRACAQLDVQHPSSAVCGHQHEGNHGEQQRRSRSPPARLGAGGAAGPARQLTARWRRRGARGRSGGWGHRMRCADNLPQAETTAAARVKARQGRFENFPCPLPAAIGARLSRNSAQHPEATLSRVLGSGRWAV